MLVRREVVYLPFDRNLAGWPTSRLSQWLLHRRPFEPQDVYLAGLAQATELHHHVLAGHVCVDGFNSSGVGAQVQRHIEGSGPALTLDVHQSFGQITVGRQGCSQ